MPRIKLVLRPNKKKADGTVPVFLRITEDRKARYLSTGVAVAPEDWNEKKEEVRRSHPAFSSYNERLLRVKHEAEAATFGLQKGRKRGVSAEAVKRELEGRGSSDFFPYAESYIQELDARGRFWEWKKAKVLKKKLRAYHGSDLLTFSDIDRAFVVGFDRYMRERLKNRTNTRAKNLQILHRILKQAIKEGIVEAGADPFLYVEVKTEPTTKEKLSLGEVRALEALVLPAGSLLEVSRDAFLFSFYCAGVRFGDLCRLQWANVEGGRLSYRMAKTGKPKSVPIPAPALGILDRYRAGRSEDDPFVFPLLEPDVDLEDGSRVRRRIATKNTLVNVCLKDLAKRIETSVALSFHVSRHSFADYARRQSRDLYAISKALGHSKLATTQTYLKSFDEDAVDALMDGLFAG